MNPNTQDPYGVAQPEPTAIPQVPVQPAMPQPVAQPQVASPQPQQPATQDVAPQVAQQPQYGPQPQYAVPSQPEISQQPVVMSSGATGLEQYTINAQVKPLEIEGGSDLLAAMHRHERASSIVAVVAIVVISGVLLGMTYRVHGIRQHNKTTYERALYERSPTYRADQARNLFGPEQVDRPDGTLDVSQQVDSYYLADDQNLTGVVGQQNNLFNGASFLVQSIDDNWKPSSEGKIYQPKEGYRLVKVVMWTGNRDAQAQSVSFDYLANTGTTDDTVFPKSLTPPGTFTDGVKEVGFGNSLNPKETKRLGVVLEIPLAARSIIFVDKGNAYNKDGKYVNKTMKVQYAL